MSGQILFSIDALPQNLPLAKDGRVRLLAVTSAERVAQATDLPTVVELGLPELVADNYVGVFAPAGLPDAIAQRLRAAIQQALAITQGHVQAANVACYEVLQEHSAFLAGVWAVHLTRSGTVAHLSGEKVKPGLKGRAAFIHGVQSAGGRAFLTTFTGDPHDVGLTARYADALFDQGADVVFAMIDGGRAGLVRACQRRGVAHIGNVVDWVTKAPDQFIASAVADSGRLLAQIMDDATRGMLPLGQQVTVGLEHPEWVRLALGAAIDSSTRAALAHWQERILSGAVQVLTEWEGPELQLSTAVV